MKTNKPLFCIAGRSGSGKDSIVKALCEQYGWKQVISYATRPRREGEGNTHIFITEEEANAYSNDFAAFTRIGNFSYFTTNEQINDPSIKFYIIDPNGIQWLKANEPERPIFVVYIYVNEKLAQERALSRGDSLEVYQKRHEAEKSQFSRFEANKEYDVVIHNSMSLASAVNDLYYTVILEEMED